MSEPNPNPPDLPAVVLAFLAAPAPDGPGSWVRAQVTNYTTIETSADATDTLYCALLLGAWELTVCAGGSHAELFHRDTLAALSLLGDWPRALRDLRLLLTGPGLDLLLKLRGADHVKTASRRSCASEA